MDEKYYNDIKNFIDEHFDVVPTWLMKKAYYNEENMNDLYEMTVSDDGPDSMLPDREVMYVSKDAEMDKFITENVEKVSKMGFRIFQIDVEDRILLGSDQWQINDKGQTFYEASVAPHSLLTLQRYLEPIYCINRFYIICYLFRLRN